MFQKKSLGQNFLKNKKILKKIVVVGGVKMGETVLEIGPGEGDLTKELLGAGAKVVAVEKDDRLIPILSELFEKELKNGSLTLIHGDISRISIHELPLGGSYKLIANIPYYITGLIIRTFLESTKQPEKIVVLVQKEVADRICTKDGKESLLSVSVKVYGNPVNEGLVKAGNFNPAPNVDSSILAIHNISKDYFTQNNIEEKRFFEVLKVSFAGKRKMLRGKLASFAKNGENIEEILKKSDIPETARAEKVPYQNWGKLVKLIS